MSMSITYDETLPTRLSLNAEVSRTWTT